MNKKRTGLSSRDLKWIAVITMTIDHAGLCLVRTNPYYGYFRTIGRIAFPIYCFLLVEGFCHTRNIKKYALRLFLFAMISEIPFNLMVSGQICYSGGQNVYVTLLLGLIFLRIFLYFQIRQQEFLGFAALAGTAWLAYALKTDYHVWGILYIFLFYLFRGNKSALAVSEAAAFWLTGGREKYAVISLIPVFLYSGEKGKDRGKYFFYVYYPLHMLVLYAMRLLLLYSYV